MVIRTSIGSMPEMVVWWLWWVMMTVVDNDGDSISESVALFQVSPSLVAGSHAEAYVVNADDGVKIPSNTQFLDISNDGSSQNELTITSETIVSRPLLGDADQSSALTPKPADQAAANAGKIVDPQSAVEAGISGLSSQENSVTRTRSRDVMDFAHLKMKLVQLTGPNKDTAAPSAAAAKTKPETEETKDMSADAGGAGAVPAVSVTPNSESQLSVGRPVTGQQVLAGNQAADVQSAAQRGPSVSPDPSNVQAQAASQQASHPDLLVTAVVQRDAQPAVAASAAGQTRTVPSNGEHATAPVQPVKPVPVYPVTVAAALPQQKAAVGPVGQVNGGIQPVPAGMLAPDMLLQQYQIASAMPAMVDGTAGFVPVQPGVVGDSMPASPDGVNHAMTAQQPTAADYSQASLLALYNQMMMSMPLMATAWPAFGLNPFLVAGNPMLAAQMMYGAQLMPQVSDAVGQMPGSDAHLGMQSQSAVPAGVGLEQLQREQMVRPMTGLPPLASMPSGGIPVAGMSAVAGARPVAPRAVFGHEHHSAATHAAGVQKKRPDRPPHLAHLEQALIEKLGPRKPTAPAMHAHAMPSPAAQSLPGYWFPAPYGPHVQPAHTPTAVQSPVISPQFVTDQHPPAAGSSLPAELLTSSALVPSTSLTATAVHSGRTTPSVATMPESVPTGKSATAVTAASSQKLTSESVEAVHAATTSASDNLVVASASSAGHMPSSRKLQFTVSAVKDDPLAVNNLQDAAPVCEAANATGEVVTQNPPPISASAQNNVSVPSGMQELAAVSAGKAPVKKGRFRISDVKEDTDTGVSSSPLESNSMPQESTARSEPSHNCITAAAPELSAHQVSSSLRLAFSFC